MTQNVRMFPFPRVFNDLPRSNLLPLRALTLLRQRSLTLTLSERLCTPLHKHKRNALTPINSHVHRSPSSAPTLPTRYCSGPPSSSPPKLPPPSQYHILGPSFTWDAFFKGIDTDGDGLFDVDEFSEAVVKVYHVELLAEDGSVVTGAGADEKSDNDEEGKASPAHEAAPPAAGMSSEDRFAAMDTDGNGHISRPEFDAHKAKAEQQRRAREAAAIGDMGGDGCGGLSAQIPDDTDAESPLIVKEHKNIAQTVLHADELFDALDVDNSGQLSLQELMVFLGELCTDQIRRRGVERRQCR